MLSSLLSSLGPEKMMFEGVYLAAAGRKEDRDQSSSLLEGFPSGAW